MRATAALSPMLPTTPATRYLLRDDAEIGGLAIFGRRGPVDVVDGDIGAEFGEPLRHHPPQPTAGAGDERRLAIEFPAHAASPGLKSPIAFMLAALRRIIASS
jgi:hypothetical protein